MRIATWNVAYAKGAAANERRRAKMEEVDADIWILTETHDDLCPGSNYTPICSEQRESGPKLVTEGSHWVTIWSRLEVLGVVNPIQDPLRTAAALIKAPNGDLLVFGTVLPWYGDKGRNFADEIAKQRADWENIASQPDFHICVAGDFNVNLGGPHYYGSKTSKAAVAAALDSSGLVALTDYKRTPGVQEQGDFGLIDHIAVSRVLDSESATVETWGKRDCEGRSLSDHVGVVVDI